MSELDQDTKAFIASRRQQVDSLRAGGSAYQLQAADTIEARIARLESGEEVLPPDKPVRLSKKRASTGKRPSGNADKVDGSVVGAALAAAGGDKQVAWSYYIKLKSLRPGCDAKDFYAYVGR